MSDISMVDFRVISVAGMLVTALVSVLLVTGGFALGRLVRRAVERVRGAAFAGMTTPARHRCGLIVPDAGRAVRARQATWRLRL